MTLDFARSIGDNYSEYVDDELGYNYHASEVISAAESRRHRRILLADPEELDELEEQFGELSDLERWAMARRRLDADKTNYFDHIQEIIDGPLDHPALHYPEIFVDLARQHASDENLERADEVIDDIEEQWPDLSDALPMLRAQLKLRAGEVDAADQAFEKSLSEVDEQDVDLLVETAEDFCKYDAPEIAQKWIDRARQTAREIGDSASEVDLRLLERRLQDESIHDATDTSPSNDEQASPAPE